MGTALGPALGPGQGAGGGHRIGMRGEAGNEAQQALHVEGGIAQGQVGIGGGEVQSLHLGRTRSLAVATLGREEAQVGHAQRGAAFFELKTHLAHAFILGQVYPVNFEGELAVGRQQQVAQGRAGPAGLAAAGTAGHRPGRGAVQAGEKLQVVDGREVHGHPVFYGGHAVVGVGGPLHVAAHVAAPHAARQVLKLHPLAIVPDGNGQVAQGIGGQQQALAAQAHIEQQARWNEGAAQGSGQLGLVARGAAGLGQAGGCKALAASAGHGLHEGPQLGYPQLIYGKPAADTGRGQLAIEVAQQVDRGGRSLKPHVVEHAGSIGQVPEAVAQAHLHIQARDVGPARRQYQRGLMQRNRAAQRQRPLRHSRGGAVGAGREQAA